MSEARIQAGDLDESTRAALQRLILTLADTKRLMGLRYSDWVLGAPSIETGIAASSMSQDEWGHARLLYAMLKGFGVTPSVIEHERPAAAYASMDPLDGAFPDWAAVVAGMVVVDGAATTALEAFSRGRFAPAASRVPKMLAEEEFHASLGAAWYRRLAGAPEAVERLRAATEVMLPATLAWVGASDAAAAALADGGLTAAGPEILAAYRDRVRKLVAMAGVDVDAVAPAATWDPARGRGPGAPEEEVVERARGDRNRALLVE